jgi:hypothetical protein
VGVDAGVARRPRQVLVLPVGDVLVGPRITVLLRQAKVNDVDQVALLPQAPAANKVKELYRSWLLTVLWIRIRNSEFGIRMLFVHLTTYFFQWPQNLQKGSGSVVIGLQIRNSGLRIRGSGSK